MFFLQNEFIEIEEDKSVIDSLNRTISETKKLFFKHCVTIGYSRTEQENEFSPVIHFDFHIR